jgi:hypothetical protein
MFFFSLFNKCPDFMKDKKEGRMEEEEELSWNGKIINES